MLSSYRELQNTSALLPETEIHVSAFSELGKLLAAGTLVAVHLPAADALEVAAAVGDEAHHIPQRVVQENPDFVRKIAAGRNAAPKSVQRGGKVNIVISVGMEELRHFRTVQPGRQLFFSVYVYQRTISLKAQEEQPDAFDFQLNIPETNLGFRILFTEKGDVEEAGRLDGCQRRGTEFNQTALQHEDLLAPS